MIAWIARHPELSGLIAYFLLSFLVGLIPTRYHQTRWFGALLRFMTWLSSTTPPDAEGTFKLPFARFKPSISVKVVKSPPLPVIVVMALLLSGCPNLLPPQSGCRPDDTRCHNGRPQVCSPSTRWHNADRPCSEIGGVCCNTPSPFGGDVHACVRPQDCLVEDGGVQ